VVGGEGGITDEAGWRGGVQGSVGLAKFRPAPAQEIHHKISYTNHNAQEVDSAHSHPSCPKYSI